MTLVQGTTQAHHFRRKLIAFERRADLICDALDERDFVILEAFTRAAPDQTEQTESLSADANRSDERRAPAERRVEDEANRKR